LHHAASFIHLRGRKARPLPFLGGFFVALVVSGNPTRSAPKLMLPWSADDERLSAVHARRPEHHPPAVKLLEMHFPDADGDIIVIEAMRAFLERADGAVSPNLIPD